MSKKTGKPMAKLNVRISESELETLRKIDPENTSRAIRIAISQAENHQNLDQKNCFFSEDSASEFEKLRAAIDKNNTSNKRILGIVSYILFQFLRAENEIDRQESATKLKIISELLRAKF